MRHRSIAFLVLFFSGLQVAFAQQEVTLEQVVALALEKNYDVRIMQKQSESAETDNDLAWGAFLPEIRATGARVWNSNNQKLQVRSRETNDIITNEGDVSSNNTNASAQLTWTLFDGTRMFAAR